MNTLDVLSARYQHMEWADFAVTTFGETILQVPSHSTYHRGQVNTHLRDLGCEPTLVDFIAWTWFGKPAAEWPGEAA